MGGSYDFDGASDINFGQHLDIFNGATELTVSAWVNLDDLTGSQTFFGHYQSFNNADWYLDISDSKFEITLKKTADASNYLVFASDLTITNYVSTSQWFNLCWTWSGNQNRKLYIDGVDTSNSVRSTAGNVDSILAGSQDFEIGSLNSNRYLNGRLSQCMGWTRELSASEVIEQMYYPNNIIKDRGLYIPMTNSTVRDEYTGVTGTAEAGAIQSVEGPPVAFPTMI